MTQSTIEQSVALAARFADSPLEAAGPARSLARVIIGVNALALTVALALPAASHASAAAGAMISACKIAW